MKIKACGLSMAVGLTALFSASAACAELSVMLHPKIGRVSFQIRADSGETGCSPLSRMPYASRTNFILLVVDAKNGETVKQAWPLDDVLAGDVCFDSKGLVQGSVALSDFVDRRKMIKGRKYFAFWSYPGNSEGAVKIKASWGREVFVW